MATMADLDELALALPQTTKEVTDDGRPKYLANGKLFCLHRSRRPDAVDPESGERLADVVMFRVADLDVKTSITSPLSSVDSSGTSRPLTRAPMVWWPTSVCTA